jgi:hypothetical protein
MDPKQQQAQPQPGEKYKNIDRSLGKMLLYNFIGGIAWSFGTIIGLGLLVLILSFVISRVDLIPIIGGWVAQILQEAASKVQPIIPQN